MFIILPDTEPLTWVEQPDLPPPGPGQVKLEVIASAVNRADLVQRRGAYPPPPGASPVLGLECSGRVSAVGHGVTGWKVGDLACALLAGGGYASQVVCRADHLLPVPAGIDPVDAAGLPEVWATAWVNLVDEAGLADGDRVLLHAGASGVGTAAVQLCRARGARCWVIVGSDAKVERCVALGADGGTNRHSGDWVADVRRWAPSGVDIVLDPVGSTVNDDLSVMARRGRIVLIGLMGGRRAELDLARLLVNRIRLVGSVLRSRSDEEKARIVAGVRAELWPAFDAGRIAPVIAERFPIQDAEAAHARVASNETVGKVLLLA